jgi:hypothetical protein
MLSPSNHSRQGTSVFAGEFESAPASLNPAPVEVNLCFGAVFAARPERLNWNTLIRRRKTASQKKSATLENFSLNSTLSSGASK